MPKNYTNRTTVETTETVKDSETLENTKTAKDSEAETCPDNTIFDDVLRTILEKMPELSVPLINEVFHKNYPQDIKIQQLKNEHLTNNGRKQTDMLISIKNRLYHLECQSTSDGRMIIRMIEYDFSIGLENTQKEKDRYVIEFPSSCVIFLRRKHIRDALVMDLKFPDGRSMEYRVPVVWLSDYTIDKILEKNLLLLLPYYIMKYEKSKHRLETDGTYLAAMLTEYQLILKYLKTQLLDREHEKIYRDLIELITKIADYILRDSYKARQEVDRMMGGTVLKLQSDYLIEQGELIGEKRGEKRGMKMGENRINSLGQRLSEDGRLDDLMKSFTDKNFQEKLLKEYGL